MPARDTLIIDIASTGIDNAADFIDKSAIEAPSNYVKPEAINSYIEKEYASRVARAGLDLDLARVTMLGLRWGSMAGQDVLIEPCPTETAERSALIGIAARLDGKGVPPTLITYGGFHFDLPLLMRRARYLGVPFPVINLDRYRSPHRDLLNDLSDRDPSRRRSLGFYVKRLGWTDLQKPLTGAQEAQAPALGQWAELEASVRHDVTATARLAAWLGLVEPVSEPVL